MTSGIRQVTQSERDQDWWAAGLRVHPKVCCSFQLIVSLWEWHQIAWGKQEIWNLSAISHLKHRWANASSLTLKNLPAIWETLGLIPGLGRSPGEGKGYPLQYSGLENSMDCIVHGVTESDTTERFSLHFTFTIKSLCYCCYCLVTKLCPTLCHPMDCSTPGFPVLMYSKGLE